MDTTDHNRFREALQTEFQAWQALVQEMRSAGVGDINAGGKHERLHDAIRAWAEELAQLRIHDPEPARPGTELYARRHKYLGSASSDEYEEI